MDEVSRLREMILRILTHCNSCPICGMVEEHDIDCEAMAMANGEYEVEMED